MVKVWLQGLTWSCSPREEEAMPRPKRLVRSEGTMRTMSRRMACGNSHEGTQLREGLCNAEWVDASSVQLDEPRRMGSAALAAFASTAFSPAWS